MPSKVPRAMAKGDKKSVNSLVRTVRSVQKNQPVNRRFVADLARAIEQYDAQNRRAGSAYYKPSSMTCKRQMYYQRTQADEEINKVGYEMIGMADTGTRRHEAIQEVLVAMKDMGFPWLYWDIEDFLAEHRWKHGKCVDLVVKRKDGAETLLRHETLFVSFKCDGVVQDLNDGGFYLFEFKNQTDRQVAGKSKVDSKHHDQIDTYGALLELDSALVTYESRDLCTLIVPELYEITDENKTKQINKLVEVESYVERGIVPPKDTDKACKFCRYKKRCVKDK